MTLRVQSGNQTSNDRHLLALLDVKESFRLWKLACSLAWLDIKLRYKGSTIGPLWITITSGTMILAIGIIYSSLFKLPLQSYLPYVAISLILWQQGIAMLMMESCHCFLNANSTIHAIKLPFFLQAMRTVIRNSITLFLNVIIPIIVFIVFKVWPGWIIFYSLPGLLIWFINGLAISVFLGCLCARFRDIPQIIASLIQLIYYTTPIMWHAEQLKHYKHWVLFNPFYTIIEIVRAPLLGDIPSGTIWIYAIMYSLCLWIISWFVFASTRGRLAFWV